MIIAYAFILAAIKNNYTLYKLSNLQALSPKVDLVALLHDCGERPVVQHLDRQAWAVVITTAGVATPGRGPEWILMM